MPDAPDILPKITRYNRAGLARLMRLNALQCAENARAMATSRTPRRFVDSEPFAADECVYAGFGARRIVEE